VAAWAAGEESTAVEGTGLTVEATEDAAVACEEEDVLAATTAAVWKRRKWPPIRRWTHVRTATMAGEGARIRARSEGTRVLRPRTGRERIQRSTSVFILQLW
jgi:hypothetical protein